MLRAAVQVPGHSQGRHHAKGRDQRIERDATPIEARRLAHLECPRYGGVIEETHKFGMNARGVYVAPGQSIDRNGKVSGDPPDSATISFWVSGLASPFVSFGERAGRYVEAVNSGDPEEVQTVINGGFGELWAAGGGDAPEWAEVARKGVEAAYRKGELPTGVMHLTMAVDVQKSRLIYVIRGWGAGATSWLIDCGTLHGETIEEPVWDDLADLITRPVCGMPIKLTFIDSGFRPGKLPICRSTGSTRSAVASRTWCVRRRVRRSSCASRSSRRRSTSRSTAASSRRASIFCGSTRTTSSRWCTRRCAGRKGQPAPGICRSIFRRLLHADRLGSAAQNTGGQGEVGATVEGKPLPRLRSHAGGRRLPAQHAADDAGPRRAPDRATQAGCLACAGVRKRRATQPSLRRHGRARARNQR